MNTGNNKRNEPYSFKMDLTDTFNLKNPNKRLTIN